MNQSTTSALPARSMRLNTWLYWLTAAAAVLTLVLTGLTLVPDIIDPSLRNLAAAAVTGGPEVSVSVGPEIRYLSSADTPEPTILWSTRIVAFLIELAHASVLAWGLFAAAGLFRRFADGLAFSPETGRLLRRVGFALLAYLLLGSPVNTLLVLAATWHGPGEHVLTIGMGLSSEGVLMGLMAGLMIALGHVLHEAARLADDHRQIV
jgi:hypothetical protein